MKYEYLIRAMESKCKETREDILSLKDAMRTNEFVGVVFENGHEHTVKAYGEICGVPAVFSSDKGVGDFTGQINYIKHVEKNEDTVLEDILIADTEEDALNEDILDDTIQFDDGSYGIK